MKQSKKNEEYPKLEKGFVKNFEQKVADLGRPSIFIGSSAESKPIVDKVKALFPEEEFEVDAWYDGIFGQTRGDNEVEGLSNMEWLTNFTDIYDYAIFLFVPEDQLESALRKDEDGNLLKAGVTRHNVVFEFGMFLGKIGAKRCFMLMEEDNMTPFINSFFTDLKQNLNDDKIEFNEAFKMEIHKYKGDYAASLTDENVSPVDHYSLEQAAENIKTHIREHYNVAELSFLPGTSLAHGYYKNFVRILARGIIAIREENDVYQKSIEKWRKDGLNDELEQAIRSAKHVQINIVIPNSLEGARQENFTNDFEKRDYYKKPFPGYSRPMPAICDRASMDLKNPNFIIYDIPTTMNASIDAINRINPRKDIRELLKVKEIRNFKMALNRILDEASLKEETKNIKDYIRIIDISEFQKVAESLEEKKGE